MCPHRLPDVPPRGGHVPPLNAQYAHGCAIRLGLALGVFENVPPLSENVPPNVPPCAPGRWHTYPDFNGRQKRFSEGNKKNLHRVGRVRIQVWCPRQESNLYHSLRRGEFYPLNYGGPRLILQAAPRPKVGATKAKRGAKQLSA
jgi:hypothetical protein